MARRSLKARRFRKLLAAAGIIMLLLAAAYTHRELLQDLVYDLLEERWPDDTSQFSDGFGVKVPAGFLIHGIDVSHHQGRIDWKRVKSMRSGADSITFVFVKATEGRRHIDRKFESNWRHISRQGLYKGAYHYYVPHVTSTLQANNYISKVKLKPGDLPPVLDIEDESIYGSDNLLAGLLNWLRIIENHYDVRPIIYTSASFYQRHLNKPEFRAYPIWIAHYRENRPRIRQDRWTIWQYSDQGRLDGIKQNVDLNVFRGNMDDFRKLLITKK